MEEIARADEVSPDVIQYEEGSQAEVNNISNSWLKQVEERFKSQEYLKRQPSAAHVCIYRVPNGFMRGKREAYVPLHVSFGPFHKKHEKLLAMEDHKLEAVHRTLERLKPKMSITFIDDLITVVQNLEKKIKDCYEDNIIEYETKTLAWMMTMDACFILEFFRALWGEGGFSLVFRASDGQNVVWHTILMDILKLENQIPLFLLIRILELEFPTSQSAEDAEDYLFSMLSNVREFQVYPFYTESQEEKKQRADYMRKHISGDGGARHLLDLCRKATTEFLESNLTEFLESNLHLSNSDADSKVCSIAKAELLYKAGIKFKKSAGGKFGLQKSSIACSTLFLPQILVEDKTATVLLNLIAFEECHTDKQHHVFSHYISLMNDLIDSEKDVALLTKEKIIQNSVESEEAVAKMFNSFSITVGENNSVSKFAGVIKNEYDRRTIGLSGLIYRIINRLKEYLEKYPWYLVSIVTGILIFGMTAVQTVYIVKSYFKG